MAAPPRILAGFVTSILDAAERSEPGLAERVRARLHPDTRTALDAASSIAFVPVELDVEVTECLFAVAGERRAREVMHDNLAASLESPFLASFVSAAMRLLGRSPARLFGWSAKVWGHLYRDCGRLAYEEVGPNAGRLRLEALPPCIAGSRPYLAGMEASFAAAFGITDVEGEARLEAADAAAGTACFALAWKPRSG